MIIIVIVQSVILFAPFIIFFIGIFEKQWQPQPHLKERHSLSNESRCLLQNYSYCSNIFSLFFFVLLLLLSATGGSCNSLAMLAAVSFSTSSPNAGLLRVAAQSTPCCRKHLGPPAATLCFRITSFFTGSQRYVKVKRRTFHSSVCSPGSRGSCCDAGGEPSLMIGRIFI